VSDLLSQDEIDALLHGVDDVEEEEVGDSDSDASTLEYDFSSQDRIVRGRMPTLEIVNERFARHMRVSLFNMMRRSAEVSINGIQMIKFGEYIEMGTALYVAMPRPFVFNVPGAGRDRLVQIKVQLLVRGSDNEELAKTHIPLIEGTLLQAFSTSNADDLVTEAGKIELREQAVTEVQKALKDITGSDVVERVLFTGFVMQ